MTEALVRAVRRGVRVRVLVPGEIDLVRHASRREFGRLLTSGIEIYEYRASLLHAKTVTIDGVWATVGTANIDNRSLALNAEINAIFYDRGVAQRLEAIFEEDLQYARPVEYARWNRRPVWQRLLELLAAPLQSQL